MILELLCIFLWPETHSSLLAQWQYATVERGLMYNQDGRGGLWWHRFLCLFRGCRLITASVLIPWISEFKMLWPHPRVVINQFRYYAQNWKNVWLTWATQSLAQPICSVTILLKKKKKGNRRNTSRKVEEKCCLFSIQSICGKCEHINEGKGTVLLEVWEHTFIVWITYLKEKCPFQVVEYNQKCSVI